MSHFIKLKYEFERVTFSFKFLRLLCPYEFEYTNKMNRDIMKLQQIVDNCQIFLQKKNSLLYLNVSVLAKYLTKFFVDIFHSALVFFSGPQRALSYARATLDQLHIKSFTLV